MTVETSANCNTLQDTMSKVATVTYYDRKNIPKLVRIIFFKSTTNPTNILCCVKAHSHVRLGSGFLH